jgi:phosphoribosyl 1,2-cyclic phosphodiesterase
MFGKFYGVRGSYAVPGLSTVRYGGNTTCFSVWNETKEGIDRIIIDGGTGLQILGKDIITNFFQKKEVLNILQLFTHLHPDHTQGFPFFGPNYFANAVIDLYGMEALKKNVGAILSHSMIPPSFPIEYKDLKSKRVHHVVRDGDTTQSLLGSMTIKVMQAYAPSHPQQGAPYYRITDNQ